MNADSVDIRYRPERIIGTKKKNHEHVVHSSNLWGLMGLELSPQSPYNQRSFIVMLNFYPQFYPFN